MLALSVEKPLVRAFISFCHCHKTLVLILMFMSMLILLRRFTSDIDIIDNKLPDSFRLWQLMIFSSIATVVVMVITTPIMAAILVPVSVFYVFFLVCEYTLECVSELFFDKTLKCNELKTHFPI